MKSSLIFRMAFFLFLLLFGSFGAIMYVSLKIEKKQLMDTVIADAIHNSNIIEAATRYSMLQNRKQDLYRIINEVGNPEHGVVGIRYYGKDGTVLYSTDKDEIGGKVDMQVEACVICHQERIPPPMVEDKERIRIFTAPEGYRVIGLINPIKNTPECYNAACHAHSPDEKILGVLDVRMSLARVDKMMAASTMRTSIVAAVIIPLLAIAGGLFIYRFVYLRIRELIAGTREISQRRLDFRFEITSNDEISVLAEAFNQMTEELQLAQKENEEWAAELQNRVNMKTEELRRAYTHHIEVEKMVSLGKLSATVAHELNNPLSGILTYLKLIENELKRDKTLGPEKAERILGDINTVIKEIKRCGNIVKNLLIFARNKPDKLERFDLREIIDRALKMVSHHLQIKQLEHVFDVIPGSEEIEGDPDLVEQALLAIFINGIESMDDGGRLTVVLDNSNDESACIEIRDTGQGIPSDKIHAIFKPFYSTKTGEHSTGLGLPVVYGIVQRHGGDIRVESRLGIGTSFFITLPRSVDPEEFYKDQFLAPEMVPDKDEIK